MKKVEVLFRGWGECWALGTLAEDGRQTLFEYSGEALRRGVELSPLHVPLAVQAYGGFPAFLRHLPGFIDDALPDGWGWLLMDRLFLRLGRPLATMSPLDRLSFVGDRAMGALSFRPPDDASLTEEDLGLLQLATAVQDVVADRDTADLAELAVVGGSPQGARPKAMVRFDASTGRISTLADAPGDPWLVKFPARHEHREVCAVEKTWCDLAARCGIEVPHSRVFEIDETLAAFGIARFDRARGLRVPVQTFAAALHADFRLPALDYQAVLRATTFFTRDATQVEAAFRRCVFNVVFNNRDDHAKNFSLRMDERWAWRLAPAYDLTFNDGMKGHHATSVMGESLRPGRRELLALAADSRIRERAAVRVIDDVLAAADTVGDTLGRHPSVRPATLEHLVATVRANAARCRVAD